MTMNRRNFFSTVTTGTVGLVAIPEILSAAMPSTGKKHKGVLSSLKTGSVILLQGDSITDAGREKVNQLANSPASFGSGYAFMAAANLLNTMASSQFSIYNRGISGNKVYQLAERWQKDCLDLKPDILSILIGVNDFWHKLNGKYDGTVEKYENDYRQLLSLTKKTLPDVKLVICEPFAVLGCSAVNEQWYPEFDGYRASAKKMAEEFESIFIPYQTIFDEAQKHAPGKYWTGDGVHPSMAGNSLMAEAWLRALK
ncbi:MAG: SGNH/GDSL hydrolase family protein [Bacteroidota bacterium]|nr:lysophospholipase [Odoribacter sp.]MDP3644845.1 SGNH/GDSL hydrolase family protein [Bacteroidota bacterium]